MKILDAGKPHHKYVLILISVFDDVIVETISSKQCWTILGNEVEIICLYFNGVDMKHPINGKVRLYYVCNNSVFK